MTEQHQTNAPQVVRGQLIPIFDNQLGTTTNESSVDEGQRHSSDNDSMGTSPLVQDPDSVEPIINKDCNSTSEKCNEREVITIFINLLLQISQTPGRFIEIFQDFFGNAEKLGITESITSNLMHIIVDQSVYERNHHVIGAKLCQAALKCAEFEKTRFRYYLHSRWIEEVKSAFWTVQNDFNKACRLLLFSGQLFLRLEDGYVLAKDICNIMQLMVTVVNKKSMKTVCQILQVAGKELYWVEEQQVHKIIKKLKIVAQSEKFGKRMNATIARVVYLSEEIWPSTEPDPSVESILAKRKVFENFSIEFSGSRLLGSIDTKTWGLYHPNRPQPPKKPLHFLLNEDGEYILDMKFMYLFIRLLTCEPENMKEFSKWFFKNLDGDEPEESKKKPVKRNRKKAKEVK